MHSLESGFFPSSMIVRFIQMVVDGSFSWLCSVPLCDYPPVSTLLLLGIWVIYILGYHKECCYEHCTCVLVKIWMYLCGVQP